MNTHTTQTTFDDGYFLANELTVNLDLSKDADLGMAKPLTIAGGAEYRDNKCSIGCGDAASIYFERGESPQPSDTGLHSRHNVSLYVDIATTPVYALTIDAAARHEHYSDFGSKGIFQLTGRYGFADQFALRGKVSTGFRAPTLAEKITRRPTSRRLRPRCSSRRTRPPRLYWASIRSSPNDHVQRRPRRAPDQPHHHDARRL